MFNPTLPTIIYYPFKLDLEAVVTNGLRIEVRYFRKFYSPPNLKIIYDFMNSVVKCFPEVTSWDKVPKVNMTALDTPDKPKWNNREFSLTIKGEVI